MAKWYSIPLKEEEVKYLCRQLETDKNIIDDACQMAESEEDREYFDRDYELCNGVLDALYNYKKLIREE